MYTVIYTHASPYASIHAMLYTNASLGSNTYDTSTTTSSMHTIPQRRPLLCKRYVDSDNQHIYDTSTKTTRVNTIPTPHTIPRQRRLVNIRYLDNDDVLILVAVDRVLLRPLIQPHYHHHNLCMVVRGDSFLYSMAYEYAVWRDSFAYSKVCQNTVWGDSFAYSMAYEYTVRGDSFAYSMAYTGM